MLPKKLHKKLEERKANNAFRLLGIPSDMVDFSSNDYLGFSKSKSIFENTKAFLDSTNFNVNGATGSRLLSGNHKLYEKLEDTLCNFHNSETALVYNSGYDANLGFFSAVPQRGDIICYDEYSHASIRDGIQLSNAKAYKFKHNDLEDLNMMLKRVQHDSSDLYIVTESVFSMDGDSPNMEALLELSKKHDAHLVVDEAHAVGVFHQGLVNIPVFARIITFGKALGCHGAAILGSQDLKNYLVNFSRALIYTTALPPHSVATITMSYKELQTNTEAQEKLQSNIEFFQSELKRLRLQSKFVASHSAIHCCIISGNESVKNIAHQLQNKRFDVKPILSPTVPSGKERLRFCLHSYNSEQDITQVLELLATFAL
ncbi:aminotransferase class I/II-fold pyridoxal phosphate-dependent enzyme [Winogradskyella haliclonae]|uniref:8-amino-7-oxononanoate synthase n=1 Tax=Winogradskyella haliclonae TaxID=2048558 RepID=A0ABQ2BWL7_9FLAO|nr:pyridoxal phosphate-dependent aminotransferase family protein [Winogradskyella haliclonae]GGI56484.1 8-amino-7-oxononanoate synthase [Winogradskyella haliclonae]